MPDALTPLCLADEATFWPWQTWADFARRSPAQCAATTVIVPIAGFCDWGLGHPLDAEEALLLPLLRAALEKFSGPTTHLVIPPLRFVLGPDAGSAFAVDPPTAHAFLREVTSSIAAAGFRRLIFFNASPWNEELCAAASRDLRIEFALQIFRINLSGLDLDLHPTRSKSRRDVQTLLTMVLQVAPEAGSRPTTTLPPDGEKIFPLPGEASSVEAASAWGRKLWDTAVTKLVALLTEISGRPPLARDGALQKMSPPA